MTANGIAATPSGMQSMKITTTRGYRTQFVNLSSKFIFTLRLIQKDARDEVRHPVSNDHWEAHENATECA